MENEQVRAEPMATAPATTKADWLSQYRLAADYDSRRRYQEAEAIYRQILDQPRPKSISDYLYYNIQVDLGWNLQNQGKFTEAIAILQGVVTPDPKNDRAKIFLTLTLEHKQKSENIIAKGLQSIQSDPTSSWGYRDLASGLAAKGELRQGLAYLEGMLGYSLSPEQAIQLARAAENISKYESAIALYRQLVTSTLYCKWCNQLSISITSNHIDSSLTPSCFESVNPLS